MPISPLKSTRRSSGIISSIGGSLPKRYAPIDPKKLASQRFLDIRNMGRERFTQAKPAVQSLIPRPQQLRKKTFTDTLEDFGRMNPLQGIKATADYGGEALKDFATKAWGKTMGDIGTAFYETLDEKPAQEDLKSFFTRKEFTLNPIKVVKNWLKDTATVAEGLRYLTVGQAFKRTEADDEIAASMKQFSKFYEDELQAKHEELGLGEMSSFDPRKIAYNTSMGAGYLALAVGATVATKSTSAGAAILSIMESSGEYTAAIDAGKTPNEAMRIYALSGAGTFVSEKIGMDFLLKKMGGGTLVQYMKHGFTEAAQETSQTWWQNLVAKEGYDEARNITEGTIDTIISSFILGMLGGGGIQHANGNEAVIGMNNEAIAMVMQRQDMNEEEAKGFLEQIVAKYNTLEEQVKATMGSQEGFVRIPSKPTGTNNIQEVGNIAEGVREFTVNINDVLTAKNVLTDVADQKPNAVAKAKEEIQAGTSPAISLRRLEDGTLFIEDGRHRLKAYEELKIDTIPVEDVTSLYIKDTAIADEARGITPENAALVEEVRETRQPVEVTAKDVDTQLPTQKPVSPFVKKRETTILKDKIRTLARGARIGAQAKEETITFVQGEITRLINESGLELKDKKKLLERVKDVTSKEKLVKFTEKIEERIVKLDIVAQKKSIMEQIEKELKATKPKKQGAKRVAKYDYTTSKLFDTLRKHDKLTQEDAIPKHLEKSEQIDKAQKENEPVSEADLIENRFLSYKANGAKSNILMLEHILNVDIREMKEAGKEAKNDEDFEKALQDQKNIDIVRNGIAQQKGGKKGLYGAFLKFYQKGFTNQYSLINSIVGKKVSAKFHPEVMEDNRDSAAFQTAKNINRRALDILGLENDRHLATALHEMSEESFEMTDKEGNTEKYTKLEVIDIYLSVKNELISERYNNTFGEGKVNEILSTLTDTDMELGDMLQEEVQAQRDIFNKWSIENTGRDLGTEENYWMASTERTVETLDGMRLQGETPSAAKERVKSGVLTPKPKNAWNKASKHIAEAKHVEHVSRYYASVKKIFSNRAIRIDIENKFGKDVYKDLLEQINLMSLNNITTKIDAISEVFDTAVNNWVKAKIFSPTVLARQLGSMINYAEDMHIDKYISGMAKGVASPKKTFDYMWKNAPWLEARFNRGYSEALADAMKDSNSFNLKKDYFTQITTLGVRTGDVAAIIYGGYPMVMELQRQGMSEKEAFEAFHEKTLRSQQASVRSSRSLFQNNNNALVKLFFRFKNTLNQYARKQGDAIVDYANKDISAKQLAKITTIYSVLNPMLYVLLGNAVMQGFKGIFGGGDDDDNDLWGDMMEQIAIHPFQAIPVIDQMAKYAYRRTTDRPTYGEVMQLPLLSDLYSALKRITKKDISFEDFLRAMSIFQEPVTGIPTEVIRRYYGYATEGGSNTIPAGTPSGRIKLNERTPVPTRIKLNERQAAPQRIKLNR